MPPAPCASPRSVRLGAAGDFNADRNDLDFLVEFDRGAPGALSFDAYFGLKESLEALFGRAVDLVEPGAIRNPYFKESVERAKAPVYAV